MDLQRNFTRPFLHRLVNRQGAFVAKMASRAAHHPELAVYPATALEELEKGLHRSDY